ncbi:scaffold protein [Microviridae sp.]|nr:scaffold protein [Microviridae sp.]
MIKFVLRGAYGYDADKVSLETGYSCGGVSKTHQSFAEECDINTIVRKFGVGVPMPVTSQMPVSGDFTDIKNFQDAMERVVQAREAFMELPADVRARFGNEPAALIAFLDDGRNKEEAVRLGIIPKPVEVTRDVVQAVDELAAKLVKS